jgi:hypothetical protein
MNEESTIGNYHQLLNEKERLERLIENQKNIIRHDLDELKIEFKKEIKPAIDAAMFVKRFAKPQTRKQAIFTTGTGIILDLALRKILKGSNVIIQFLVPRLIKNYTSNMLLNAPRKSLSQANSK